MSGLKTIRFGDRDGLRDLFADVGVRLLSPAQLADVVLAVAAGRRKLDDARHELIIITERLKNKFPGFSPGVAAWFCLIVPTTAG